MNILYMDLIINLWLYLLEELIVDIMSKCVVIKFKWFSLIAKYVGGWINK